MGARARRAVETICPSVFHPTTGSLSEVGGMEQEDGPDGATSGLDQMPRLDKWCCPVVRFVRCRLVGESCEAARLQF